MNGIMIESNPAETIAKFESSSACAGGTYYPSMYTSPDLQVQGGYHNSLHGMQISNHHSPYNLGPMCGPTTVGQYHSMPMMPLHLPTSLQLHSSYNTSPLPAAHPVSHGYPTSTTIENHNMSVADYLTPLKRPPSVMDQDNGNIRPPSKRAAQICLKCHQPRKGHVCPFKTRTPPKTYREFPIGQGDKVITCCPNCGIPLHSGSKYCHKCGSVNAVSGQTALSLFTTQRVPKLSPEEAQQLAAKVRQKELDLARNSEVHKQFQCREWQLRAVCENVSPPCYRVLVVGGAHTLFDLSGTLAEAFGWSIAQYNYRSGQGTIIPGSYFVTSDGLTVGGARHKPCLLERKVKVVHLFPTVNDWACWKLGDWTFNIQVDGITKYKHGKLPMPRCVDGERSLLALTICPTPQALKEVHKLLSEPNHPRHLEMLEHTTSAQGIPYNPDLFDINELNTTFKGDRQLQLWVSANTSKEEYNQIVCNCLRRPFFIDGKCTCERYCRCQRV